MTKGFVIAIDGPVASGKGTLASTLSKELNGFYLYTGAMYRSVALLCIERGIDLENEKEVESVLPDLNIEFKNDKVLLSGKDVTERLKEPDTASGSSVVGVFPKIRKKSVALQRKVAEEFESKGLVVVAEGRDIGTTVFPDALLKIYLKARPEVRAMRRMEQFVKEDKDLQKELKELIVRDTRDQQRETSPLPVNPEELGYFIVDNSDMREEQTVDVIKKELVNRGLI